MARTQRTPQKKLKAWDSSQRARLIAPQNMHAVERYGLKFANEKEQGRPVSSCSPRRELRRRTGEPYVPLEEEHGWQVSNEGLSLRPKEAAALLHRKGESRPSPSTQTNVGLTRCDPKGAEALLHQKGEPRPTLNRQGYSRRGLTHRMEGSHATEGSQRLCCTERGAPSEAENARRCD